MTTRLQINGFLSKQITVKRGIRQGCPLSPLLYVVYLEPILKYIEINDEIEGIGSPGLPRPIKYLAYADDVIILCKHLSSTNTVFKIFKEFEHTTGSSLNVAKTKILTREAVSIYPGLKNFVIERLRFCGIHLSFGSFKEISLYNWRKKWEQGKSKIDKAFSQKAHLFKQK